MGTYCYYVNGFSGTYLDWQEVGASPYLNAMDAPANLIRQVNGLANRKEGNFEFQNSGAESNEALDKVYLEICLRAMSDPDSGFPALKALIHDGAAWTQINVPADSYSWTWKTVDVSSVINSWAKIDACKAYLQVTCAPEAWVDVDCMRLKAITAGMGEAAKRPSGNGLTWMIL